MDGGISSKPQVEEGKDGSPGQAVGGIWRGSWKWKKGVEERSGNSSKTEGVGRWRGLLRVGRGGTSERVATARNVGGAGEG